MTDLASRFVRLGRLAAGSAAATANLAAEIFHFGVRGGAQALSAAAAAGRGVVPGAELAGRLAEFLEAESVRSAAVARCLVAESVDLMNGASDGGRDGRGPRRLTWAELAADTALGPLASLVGLTVATGADALRSASATAPGEMAVDAVIERLGNGSPKGEPVRFDAAERRRSFVALATDSGAAAVAEAYALAEATLRLLFADTRSMRRTIERGLGEMRRLAESADLQELLPAPMVSEALHRRARLIVERAPERFLSALGNGGRSAGPVEIVRATVEDADNLRVFALVYPQAVALVGSDVGRLLVAGSVSFNEMEAFMEGRRIA